METWSKPYWENPEHAKYIRKSTTKDTEKTWIYFFPKNCYQSAAMIGLEFQNLQ